MNDLEWVAEQMRRAAAVHAAAYEVTRRARQFQGEHWAMMRDLGIIELEAALAAVGGPRPR